MKTRYAGGRSYGYIRNPEHMGSGGGDGIGKGGAGGGYLSLKVLQILQLEGQLFCYKDLII